MSTAARHAYYDPAAPDDVNFMCVHCGAQTVTGYDGPGDRGRVSHVYDDTDPRFLRSGMSECAELTPKFPPAASFLAEYVSASAMRVDSR
jgi:hypothetical protein